MERCALRSLLGEKCIMLLTGLAVVNLLILLYVVYLIFGLCHDLNDLAGTFAGKADALEKRMAAVEDALRPSRGSLPKKS